MGHFDRTKTLVIGEKLPIDDWQCVRASWAGDQLLCGDTPLDLQLISPVIKLRKRTLHRFHCDLDIINNKQLNLVLVPAGQTSDAPQHTWITHTGFMGPGAVRSGFAVVVEEDGDYRLGFCNPPGHSENQGAAVENITIQMTERGPIKDARDLQDGPQDTYLPHWGPVRRFLHRRCKSSRNFNAFVAAIEMRLGREEVLSVPMYMALCPTGQCNALCDFCSVTIARTGIIKKQLPWGKLTHLLDVTRNTLMMCGLEGNGEPTLYKQFDELVGLIRSGGSDVYLITNGSRLVDEQIPVVLGTSSVTFSLNACTAETHQRVMKLRNWPDVVRNIKGIVEGRGTNRLPSVYVSFVVYDYNVHELQQFMDFAENELRADVVVIRPLSELGTDELGTIEDLRDIVPFESDVRDAIDAANEYISDTPRRHTPFLLGHPYSEIWFDPTAFRNVRPDPLDRVVMPRGFEDRLLAPRRGDWHAETPDLDARWHLNTARIICGGLMTEGVVWSSAYTPVNPGAILRFQAKLHLAGAPIEIQVADENGNVVAAQAVTPTNRNQLAEIDFEVPTGENLRLRLQFAIKGSGGFMAWIDFGRLRTPGFGIRQTFQLPFARRWAVDTPGVTAEWNEAALSLRYEGDSKGYLYKSYFAPCLPDVEIELPVRIHVRRGSMSVGFLNQDAQSWISQKRFGPGETDAVLKIPTGANRRLQTVITAPGGDGLDATIDWGNALEPAPQRAAQTEHVAGGTSLSTFDLGIASRWYECCEGATAVQKDGVVALRHAAPPAGPALAHGEAINCMPGIRLRMPLKLVVRKGTPVIGIMNEAQDGFLFQQILKPGTHELVAEFDTEKSHWMMFSLAAYTTDEVDVSLELPTTADAVFPDAAFPAAPARIEAAAVSAAAASEAAAAEITAAPPQETAPEIAQAAESTAPAAVVPAIATPSATGETDAKQRALAAARKAKKPAKQPWWPAFAARLLRSPNQIYCPKPWTDLNNFTVDGRMDVCCITTGASQSSYALGNIETQSFQEIWNGPTIRQFRKTVNAPDKLPPCARCPMTLAYNGPFFNRAHTLVLFREYLEGFGIMRRLPPLARVTHKVAEVVLDLAHFRIMRRD